MARRTIAPTLLGPPAVSGPVLVWPDPSPPPPTWEKKEDQTGVRLTTPPPLWTQILTELQSETDDDECRAELQVHLKHQWFVIPPDQADVWTPLCHVEKALGLSKGAVKKTLKTATRQNSPAVRGQDFCALVSIQELRAAGYVEPTYEDRRHSSHPQRQMISFAGLEEFLFGGSGSSAKRRRVIPSIIHEEAWQELLQQVRGPPLTEAAIAACK